jgi:AbrB family looped-hinge helix DNA binding protein
MSLAKLSSKCQIVIPAEIRLRMKIKPGDLLEITEEKKEIRIRRAPQSYVNSLENCISEIWQGYEAELDKARDQWDG